MIKTFTAAKEAVAKKHHNNLPKVFQKRELSRQLECAGRYARYGKKGD